MLRNPPPPAGVDSQILTGQVTVMTWRSALEDRKGARGWTKGSFPVHLDLHLPQLGKICPVTTFDPTSYWTKAGPEPVLFNMGFCGHLIGVEGQTSVWNH